MKDTSVVVGGNVQGDITSCKIETSAIYVDKASLFSLQQKTTYRSYDVCTKQLVKEYVVPEITGFGMATVMLMVPIVIILIIGFFSTR